jgi:hypothetical protein
MILANLSEKNSDLNQIDEFCNFNDIFLLPFKHLMESKKLDRHLQDTVLTSLRVLIECKSTQMKTSWSIIFSCLAHISLNSKHYDNLKKLVKTKSDSSSGLDLEMSPIYDVNNESETCCSDSAESCPESEDSSESENESNWSLSTNFKSSLRFDSYRIRLMSFLEMFDIYLNEAYNSTYLLENGSFEFIKCIVNYLQYSTHITVYNPADYVFHHPEMTTTATPK